MSEIIQSTTPSRNISALLERITEMSVETYYNPYKMFEWPETLPDEQWWMTPELAVRLTALAAGTTLSVTVEVASDPLEGDTANRFGLGYLLMLYQTNLNIPGVFAVLVVLSAVGLVLHAAVVYCRKRIVFWVGEEQTAFTGA